MFLLKLSMTLTSSKKSADPVEIDDIESVKHKGRKVIMRVAVALNVPLALIVITTISKMVG